MARKFAVGGETARDAFYDVIEALGEMEDPVSQSIAGVDLFGTMWEDLGPEVVTQLANIQNGYDKTKATMEEINDIKYDDIGSALKSVKRNIETNILIPLSEDAMPTMNEFAKGAKEAVKKAAELMSEAGARKVRVLKTSGPFHTTKLIEASKALSKELENTKFNKSNLIKSIDRNSII